MSFWLSARREQRYARIMEIAGYILALPGLAFFCVLYYDRSIFIQSWETSYHQPPWILTQAPPMTGFLVFAFGVGLLAFYMAASRLELNRWAMALGWLVSLLFNVLPLLMLGSILYEELQIHQNSGTLFVEFMLLLPFFIWPLVAVYYSVRALWATFSAPGSVLPTNAYVNEG